MFIGKLIFIFLLSQICSASVQDVNPLIVTTKNGKIKGITLETKTGKEVNAWLGIPYAKPPVGNLRFKKPQPPNSWDDKILETHSWPNTCTQIIQKTDFIGITVTNPNTPISEDCLYLNIFAPKPHPENAAVMLWIYGGGFFSGTSTLNFYDPKILVSEENVIFVSIQYRVASLGFLYFGTEDAPGNMGLFDQLQALQWVYENIENFGGDPKKITLFGGSAGAASVSFHLLSPLSRNYFHQGIMQSGAANSNFATISNEEAIRRSLFLANDVGCPSDISDIPGIIQCLQNKDAEELVYKEWNIARGAGKIPFVVVKDGDFIVENPQKYLQDKNFKQTNIMLGSNSDEGYLFLFKPLPDIFRIEENITTTRDQFLKSIPKISPFNNTMATQAIIFEYTDWNFPHDIIKNRNALSELMGDFFFYCPENEFAYAYSKANQNVFKYLFGHRSSQHLWPSWMGVSHGDEINFIFGRPLDSSLNYTSEEVELSKKMMKFWTNFAKTGNPNFDGSKTWPEYSIEKREHIILNAEPAKIGYAFRSRQCVFLQKYLPKVISMTESLKSNNVIHVIEDFTS